MGLLVTHVFEAKSKTVDVRMPLLSVPLCPPALSRRPSGRNECPLQKRSAGFDIDANVTVPFVPLCGGVQSTGTLSLRPQLSTRPSGNRWVWMATDPTRPHVIGEDHCPTFEIGEIRSKLTITFCDADIVS